MKHTSPTRLVGLSLGIELIWLAILMVCRVWVWAEKASSGFIQEPICNHKPLQKLTATNVGPCLVMLGAFLGHPVCDPLGTQRWLGSFLAFGAFAGFSEGAPQAEDINWSSPLPFAGRLITFFEELAGLDITAGMAESQSNHSHSDKASSSQWQAKIMPTHYNVIGLNKLEMLNAKACQCYFFIASLHNSN